MWHTHPHMKGSTIIPEVVNRYLSRLDVHIVVLAYLKVPEVKVQR